MTAGLRLPVSVVALVLILSGLLAQSCVPSRTASDSLAARRFGARADSLRATARIPGLAVVVLRDTTILLARGYGYADLETRAPVTPETPFNIASVSKPVSAVVALRLVEQGLLDLERPMRTYAGFSEFCDEARAAGGIFFDDFLCADTTLTLRHVLGMTANGTRPGSRFFYNPVSYSWASRPMMEVTGQPFSSLVRDLVFRPAGMTRSARSHRTQPLPPEIAAALARPYHVDSSGTVVPSAPPPPQGDGAAGGVVSTALDLARFDIAMAQGRLISETSRRAMWTPQRTPDGERIPYGIGWFIQDYGGETLLWHTGLWEGAYSALYLKVPARRLTLILLANSDGLSWETRLDEARADRSPFVRALLEEFSEK